MSTLKSCSSFGDRAYADLRPRNSNLKVQWPSSSMLCTHLLAGPCLTFVAEVHLFPLPFLARSSPPPTSVFRPRSVDINKRSAEYARRKCAAIELPDENEGANEGSSNSSGKKIWIIAILKSNYKSNSHPFLRLQMEYQVQKWHFLNIMYFQISLSLSSLSTR